MEVLVSIGGVGGARGRTVRRALPIDQRLRDQAIVFDLSNAGPSSVRVAAWRQGRPVCSAPVDITFDPSVQVRDGGGPAKRLLKGKAVSLIPLNELSASAKFWAGLEEAAKLTFTRDLVKLLKLANGGALPGASKDADPGRAAQIQAAAEAQMKRAIEQAAAQVGLAEAVATFTPHLGQAMAGGRALDALTKWLETNWDVYKIKNHQEMLVATPAASGRRHTVHAAAEGLSQFKAGMGKKTYLAKAGINVAEFALRFIPGAGIAVGAAGNAAMVTLLIFKNYEEAELATRTKALLAASEASMTPDLYYQTIRDGHVAALCHILAGYSEAQILDLDRRSRLILDGVVPIVGIFARAKDALKNFRKPPDEPQRLVIAAKAATALKTRAKDVQDELRYKITVRLTEHAPQAPRPEGVRPRNRL